MISYPRGLDDLDVTWTANRTEILQLMRSAPLVHEKYFNSILAITNRADSDTSNLRDILKRYRERPARLELKDFDDKNIAEEYAKLVLSQSKAILGILRGVCGLSNLLNEIKTGKDTEGFDMRNITCPPDSDPFSDFIASWKASREQQFKE